MTVRAARTPFFLEYDGQRLYFIQFRPERPADSRGAVVFFHPFAEEMNRSRRMSTGLGEALAAANIELVAFDCYGTGDSDGEFADARWDRWVENGIAAVEWASEQVGGPVAVLGLRLGAALALSAAKARPDRVSRAVLWQPVASGLTFLTQFLRIRVAASLNDGKNKETTQGLRAQLDAGEALEVAGYMLDPALTAGIDGVSLAAHPPLPSLPVDWMEISGDGVQISPAGRRVVDSWRTAGVRVRDTAMTGDLFWTTQEITTAPSLIEATVARLGEPAP